MDKSSNVQRLLAILIICVVVLALIVLGLAALRRTPTSASVNTPVLAGVFTVSPTADLVNSSATSFSSLTSTRQTAIPSISPMPSSVFATVTALVGIELTRVAPQNNAIMTVLSFETQTATVQGTSTPSLTPSLTPTSSPQTLTVTKLDDTYETNCDNGCSLRGAINAAPYGATIEFAQGLSGKITLTGPLQISKSLTIKGPGPKSNAITISGDDKYAVFLVAQRIILHLSNLTISNGNYTTGGGIQNRFGTLYIDDCTFQANSADAIENIDGILEIQRSTFDDNLDNAVSTLRGTVKIVNSTFHGNQQNGLGIGSYSGTMLIVNSTFKDDRAHGGLIFDISPRRGIATPNPPTVPGLQGTPEPGEIILVNTIVSGGPNNRLCDEPIIDGGHNLQYPGVHCGSSIPSADPLLGTLQDNGGPTQTIALSPGSPAIGAGDISTCTNAMLQNIDQRGLPRSVEGTTGKGALCDIGAFEYNRGSTPAATISSLSFSTNDINSLCLCNTHKMFA